MATKCLKKLEGGDKAVALKAILVLFGIGLLPLSSGAGGSTRLKDIEESQFKDMVEDIGHIQEEFEDLFTEDDLQAMDPDELAFTWFSAHDGDQSGSLDGLELFKSVIHSHVPEAAPQATGGWAAEHQTQPPEMTIPQEDIDATTGLVDDLLENHDWNTDGFLDFPEFMSCFSENKEKLKI